MSKNINKTDDPKNDDIIKETKYITYVERGFSGGYELYDDLNEALDAMSYNELYIAHKVDEKTLSKWLALKSIYKKL